jgi:hypothetical protein
MANDWQVVYKSDNLRVSKRDYAGSALDEIKGRGAGKSLAECGDGAAQGCAL